MAKSRLYLLVLAVGVLALLLAGCPAKKPAATATGPTAGPAGSTGPAEPGSPPTGVAPADTGATTGQAPLTKDAVMNVMASMEDKKIKEIMDGIVEELGVKKDESPEAIKKVLDKAAASAAMTEAVKAHGFKDAAEWAATLKRVMPGMAKAMEKMFADMAGPEAAGKAAKGGAGGDEFKAFTDAFGEPSQADIDTIAAVMKEQMESKAGAAGKSAP
jgi:hypothetical protein